MQPQWHFLADFLALQPVFKARSSAPLWLMGSPRVALLNFWIPVGFVLTSRVSLFAPACLVSLCTSTSLFPPDTLDYSARAHSL